MKVSRRDGGIERRILISMITDVAVLSRIAARWEKGLFRSKWAGFVAEWCVRYYEKHRKAPGRSIEVSFMLWAKKTADADTVALVERFLEGLSDEYDANPEEFNSDYIVDQAGVFFQENKLRKLSEDIQASVDAGNLEEAQGRVDHYHPLELGVDEGVDFFDDEAGIKEAFESASQPLITFDGALGNFFGNCFERDSLIGIQAPEKRAKSFWLLRIACQALRQKRKVAYFQVGDLSKNQLRRRFLTYFSRRPFYATKGNKDESLNHPIRVPTFVEVPQGQKMAKVDYEERDFGKPMSLKEALQAFRNYRDKKLDGKKDLLKLCVRPADTINVRGMESMLTSWERNDDWTPDVIVCDYADILAPMGQTKDRRDMINESWIALASLRQKLHCCIVTATQTDAASYDAYTITRKHFSEDKRKYAHVTGMFCINQTDTEKENQTMRLNWVQRREAEFLESRCLHVAGCLAIANPAIKSTF